MDKDTVFNSFVLEVGKALATLEAIIADQSLSDNLLLDLGYSVPGPINAAYSDLQPALTAFTTSITDIIDKLSDDNVDEAALTLDVITLLGALNQLIQYIQQLPSKIDTALAAFQDFLNNSGIKDNFPLRLTNYIIIKFLDENHPTMSSFFRLIGLIEVTFVEKGTYNPDFYLYEIKWDRFQNLYTHPKKNFVLSYGWGSAEIDYYKLLSNIKGFAWSIGKLTYQEPDVELPVTPNLPVLTNENKHLLLRVPMWSGMISTGDGPEDHASLTADILVYPIIDPAVPDKTGLAFAPFVEGTISQAIPIGQIFELDLSADVQLGGNAGIAVNSQDGVYLFADPLNFKGTFGVVLKRSDEEKLSLFNLSGFGIYITNISAGTRLIVETGQDPEFIVELSFTCASGISGEKADSFIQKFLQSLAFDFTSTIAYSNKRGLYFSGSGSFEIKIPLNLEVGVLKIEEVYITAKLPEKEAIPVTIDASFSLTIGPLFATVQRIGFTANLGFIGPGGQLGPVSFNVDFKPPTGIGMSLDTSMVKAGGFLSINPDEYIGALELEIKSFQLAIKAVAIINTKLPGGQPGFSLLVIITAEFQPIQLGYGFSLNGLGGLFGYKRSFEAQELRAGLKTGALDSILFPKNLIANIDNVVSDLKRVFPMGNNFLIGPMVKIGWGTSLVTAEIGILVQVPDPVIIAILGIIRLALPDPDEPVVLLQINFLGVIDFEKKMLSLDASLSDSRVLTFTITGDFAVRLGWGSPALFIFSSGGFHPDFKEAPVELQHMDRLGIQIINEEDLKLGAGTYLALTTNTVQIGAAIKFWAKSGDYTALAEVGFDALIQFDPFFFSVAVYLTGRVTGPMVDVVIDVRGNLAGPNPWHLWGHAHAKVVFFEITIPFDKTFGDPIEELAAGLQNVLELLKGEVPKDTNWKAITVIDGSSKVSLRNVTPDAGNMIVHPNTKLSFNQRVVPLEVAIQNFGQQGIDGANMFSLSASISGANAPALVENILYDSFAPGNFFDIRQDQKLSRPSFEQMKSGKELSLPATPAGTATPVEKEIDYEVIYIRKKKKANEGAISVLNGKQVMLLASGGSAAKSKLSVENNRVSYQAPPKITINKPGYNVVNKSDLSPAKQGNATMPTYGNQTEAYNKQSELDGNETLILSTQEL